ncbi:MAG: 3-dehydroquinate synthase family protein [Candidatus Kapaibacterium sp.]
MRKVYFRITDSRECEFLSGDDISIPGLIKNDTTIITDENLAKIYEGELKPYRKIIIPAGEEGKSLNSLENIFCTLLKFGIEKKSLIAAFGGGSVCDITGLAASLYKRGCRAVYIPTTLLAQADAALGGKTAINFAGIKNLLGTVRQPEQIISCPRYLNSLGYDEFSNGLAEIVKTSLIADNDLFLYLLENKEKIKNRSYEHIEHITYSSALHKMRLVEADPFDRNIRQYLNFGHTFANAAEPVLKIAHGKAVSIGIIKDLEISHKLGILCEQVLRKARLLLAFFNLPVDIESISSKISANMSEDKKNFNKKLKIVLVRAPGDPLIKKITIKEYMDLLK